MMSSIESHDPRDIPILTDEVDEHGGRYTRIDAKAVHAAVVTETLQLADTLLNQAAKEIEATLFQRVFDELRARLPELVDRALGEHAHREVTAPKSEAPTDAADPRG